jgi:hypothetical protein
MVDWKNGGHRKNCGFYTMLSLGALYPLGLTLLLNYSYEQRNLPHVRWVSMSDSSCEH